MWIYEHDVGTRDFPSMVHLLNHSHICTGSTTNGMTFVPIDDFKGLHAYTLRENEQLRELVQQMQDLIAEHEEVIADLMEKLEEN